MATVGIELSDVGNCVLIEEDGASRTLAMGEGEDFSSLRLRSGRGIDVWICSSGYGIRLSPPYLQRVLGRFVLSIHKFGWVLQ